MLNENEKKELECFEQHFFPERQPLVDAYFNEAEKPFEKERKIRHLFGWVMYLFNPFVLMTICVIWMSFHQ